MALYIFGYLRAFSLCVVLIDLSAGYDKNPFINEKHKWLSTNPSGLNKIHVNTMLSDNPFFEQMPDKSIKLSSNPFFSKIPKNPEAQFERATTSEINIYRNPFLKEVLEKTTRKPYVPKVSTELNSTLPPKVLVYPIYERRAHLEESLDDICGKPILNSLAARGEKIRMGDHPWIAALWHMDKQNRLHFQCGASVISDRHVVTAAHCVNEMKHAPERIVFYIGYTNVSWSNYIIDPSKGVVRGKSVHINPKYKGYEAEGDIAIIELSEPIIFSSTIRPLCLWPKKYKTEFTSIINFTGQVAGWGKNEDGTLNLDKATAVRMPTVSKETCLWSDDAYYKLVTNETFCAGKKDGKGPCKGDSGSSFILQLDGRWVLRGIVSHSLRSQQNQELCNFYQYTVFADAAMDLDWFADIMKQK